MFLGLPGEGHQHDLAAVLGEFLLQSVDFFQFSGGELGNFEFLLHRQQNDLLICAGELCLELVQLLKILSGDLCVIVLNRVTLLSYGKPRLHHSHTYINTAGDG